MQQQILSKRVFELKETEEEINTMCEEVQKIYNEGQIQGEIKTKK